MMNELSEFPKDLQNMIDDYRYIAEGKEALGHLENLSKMYYCRTIARIWVEFKSWWSPFYGGFAKREQFTGFHDIRLYLTDRGGEYSKLYRTLQFEMEDNKWKLAAKFREQHPTNLSEIDRLVEIENINFMALKLYGHPFELIQGIYDAIKTERFSVPYLTELYNQRKQRQEEERNREKGKCAIM